MPPPRNSITRQEKIRELIAKFRKPKALRASETRIVADRTYHLSKSPLVSDNGYAGTVVTLNTSGEQTPPTGTVIFDMKASGVELYKKQLGSPAKTGLISGLGVRPPRKKTSSGDSRRPSAREGRGLGTIIVQELIDEARKAGSKRVVCEVNAGNRQSRQLFEKLGFKIVIKFTSVNGEVILMEKNLRNLPKNKKAGKE